MRWCSTCTGSTPRWTRSSRRGIILEELACQLAAERTDEADLAALRRFAVEGPLEPGSDPRGLHLLVAEISRNAGLALFVDVFNQVAQLYSPDWQNFGRAIGRETEHAHAKIAQALMAGDAGLARNRMRKHLEAEADFFRRRRSTRQLLPDSVVLAESAQGKGRRRWRVTSRRPWWRRICNRAIWWGPSPS